MADTLTLDNAADSTVPLSWVDDQGAVIDISTADVQLHVKGGFSVVAGLDPSNPQGRLFEITAAQAQTLGSAPHDYLILVNGTPSRGTITSAGFVPL